MGFLNNAIVLGALAALAAALPVKRQTAGYTLAVSKSDASINANDGAFWTGKPTASYCATGDCSSYSNTTTVYAGSDSGSAFMYAEVPGGQDIYVAPSGALSFTEPHEEGIYPTGSFTSGFSVATSGGQTLFTFDGTDNAGWALCGEYGQVYALIDGNQCEDPQAITIQTTAASEPGAFEYE